MARFAIFLTDAALLPTDLADKLREQIDTNVPYRKKSPLRSKATQQSHQEHEPRSNEDQDQILPETNQTVSKEIIQEKTRELVKAKIASTETFHFALSRPLLSVCSHVRIDKVPYWPPKL